MHWDPHEHFYTSWMCDDDRVNRLHSRISVERLRERAPLSILEVIQELTCAVENNCWLLVNCCCAILAELIAGSATGGGTFKTARRDEDLTSLVEGLRRLRNACFHPAEITADRNFPTTPMEHLLTYLPKGLIDELSEEDRPLRDPRLAAWALTELQQVGLALS